MTTNFSYVRLTHIVDFTNLSLFTQMTDPICMHSLTKPGFANRIIRCNEIIIELFVIKSYPYLYCDISAAVR